MEELTEIKDISTCPFCKSLKKEETNSLHAWENVYECGCVLTGAIDNDKIFVQTRCTKKLLKEKFKKAGLERALRYNKGKLNWGLVNFKSLEPLVKVLMFGANKYEANNWMKEMPLKEIEESAFRHLIAIMDGEIYDKESGELHIGHLMCNAMFWNYHYNKSNKAK